MDRETMIELLVGDALVRATEGRGLSRLADILRNGFSGYGAFSDEELRDEIEIHGLAALDADADSDSDSDDEDLSAHDAAEIDDLRELSMEDDRFS
jgi:hypothetical protein